MELDFHLNKYRELCEAIRSCGYTAFTVGDYLDKLDPGDKLVILRHDVDRKPQRALRMAELEHEFGIKASYYFRFNKIVFLPVLIKEIASLGHEIGYHYETLDKAKGNYTEALQIFENELSKFREIAEIRTICMHGNPLTKWVNRDLWTRYDYRSFNLKGEAYLSFSDVADYFSDTGRTWKNEHKVKDTISLSNANQGTRKVSVSSTDDIIELLRKGELSRAYLTIHPERWSHSLIAWTADSLKDGLVNIAKWVIVNGRKGQKIKGD